MKLLEDLGSVEEKAVVSWLLVSAKHMAINYKRGLEREVLYRDLLYEESEELKLPTPYGVLNLEKSIL